MKRFFAIDQANLRAVTPVRITLGVAIPLLVAAARHETPAGVLMALGALYAGLSSYRGSYLHRFRTMLMTSAVTATMTYVGGLLSGHAALALPVIATASLIGAVYGSRSQAANTLSIQAIAVLVVLSGIRATAQNPLADASLVLGGGLFQALLLLGFWPHYGRRPERRALADIYRSLARFVRSTLTCGPDIADAPVLPDRAVLQQAWDMTPGGKAGNTERTEFESRLMDAEAIRAALAGFARAYRQCGEDPAVRREAEKIAQHLEAIGRAMFRKTAMPARPVIEPPPHRPLDDRNPEGWLHLIAVLLAEVVQPGGREWKGGGWRSGRSFPSYRIPVSILARVFLRPDLRGLTQRHAVRYALAMAAAVEISKIWPLGHSYWLPLTVCLTLRSDYAGTVDRSLSRVLGTIVGVALAEGFIFLVHPSPSLLIGMMLVGALIAGTLFLANYTYYSVGITLYVIGSVAAASARGPQSGAERLIATASGAAIALLASLLVPIWKSREIRTILRDAVRAQVDFAERVLAEPSCETDASVREMQQLARSLHVEAERAVAGAAHEPDWSRLAHPFDAEEVLRRLDDNAAVFLAYQAAARAYGEPASPLAEAGQAKDALARSREILAQLEDEDARAPISSGAAGRPEVR